MSRGPHSYYAQSTRYAHRPLPPSMSVPEAAHALLPHHTATSDPPSPEAATHYICRTASHAPLRACSSQSPPSIPRHPVPMRQSADRQHNSPAQSAPAQHNNPAQSAPVQHNNPAHPPSPQYAFHPNMPSSSETHHRVPAQQPAQPQPQSQPMYPPAAQPLRRQQTYHHIQSQFQYRHNAPQPPSSAASFRQPQPSQQHSLAQHPADRPSMAAARPPIEPSQHPPPTHVSPPHLHHHRPYELQPTAPASRTFWNHYETGLLVQLWLQFEAQFLANKRNAGVWAQLAQQLTERSGRHRTVRECRIKWKNMWAKHRDLANASHMDLDAKLREFPHFSQFVAIRQRSSQSQHALQNEGSEGKQTPSEDDRRASATAPSDPLPKWTHLEPPGAVAGPAAYSPHHTYNPAPDHATLAVEPPPYVQATFTAAPAPRGYDERRSSLASILIADRHSDHESRNYRSPGATYAAATHSDTLPRLQAHHTPSHLTEAVSSMTVNSIPAIATSRGSSESQDRTGATSITDIPSLLRQADSSAGCYSAFDGDDYGLDIHTAAFSQSIDGIIERMRALAGTSTSADISTAAQQIMNYVERESRRRHIQSERHLHVVSALAEVMSRSSADTTAAPSASTSRRSSGPAHEHRRYHPAALNQKPEDSALHMIHEVPAPASRNIEQQIVADTAGPGNGAATHDSNIPHRRAETHSPPANSNTIKLAAASPMNPAKTDSPL